MRKERDSEELIVENERYYQNRENRVRLIPVAIPQILEWSD